MTAGRAPILRIVRPARDLSALKEFYCTALGFELLESFDDHDGFAALIVGYAGAPWHFGFVDEKARSVLPNPDVEDLRVLYLPEKDEWRSAVDRMGACGYEPVPSNNPYWDRTGLTFADPEGFRIVLQNGSWDC